MLIKGLPGEWREPRLPVRIPQDRGSRYVDQNASRHPEYPLEPLFRSIYTVSPTFDPKQINLVTDRNNLRKIMWVISGIHIEDFRIDIELVGDTLLFTRWEKVTKEYVVGFRGFGHEFEKWCTTYPEALEKSTGHHRVVQYTLAKFKILLRFEVDGYLQSETKKTTSSASQDIDDLTSSLKSVTLGPSTRTIDDPQNIGTNLKVIRGGVNIPHASLMEMKTRVMHKPIQTDDVIFQLWFAQLHHLKIGYHSRGVFSRMDEKNFKKNGEFERFERGKERELRKLIALMENIKKVLKVLKGKRAVLLYERGSLRIYERKGDKHALPADLLSMWE